MTTSELEVLRFRRQYLFLPFQTNCPFIHKTHTVNQYTLYAHQDLKVSTMEKNGLKLILLGDLFDYVHTGYNNDEILEDLIQYSPDLLPEKLSVYCGRFVLIAASAEKLMMIHDAASARKVFYYKSSRGLCCASQPHLLARVLDLKFTDDPDKVAYYRSKEFRGLSHANIGNTTCYDGMYQLRANHFLDVYSMTSVRYWPDKFMEYRPLDEIAGRASQMLEGYMKAIGNRYEVMLPVTAGKDSRLLLAASRSFVKNVYCYLNKHQWNRKKNYDIDIPRKLLSKLGLDFHVLIPSETIDNDFRKVFFENNPMAFEPILPVIYNYYVHFQNKVNLPGIFVNAAEEIWETGGRELTPEYLAELVYAGNYQFGLTFFAEWYASCRDVCSRLNVDPLYLLYWEERVGNWGTQVQLDKDIAQEDIVPFNSRLLIETMMSVKVSEREKPDFLLNAAMIEKLWPETLQMPMNPYFKQNVLLFTKTMGVMKPIKTVYYYVLFFLKKLKPKAFLK